jgi:hypothetical protein
MSNDWGEFDGVRAARARRDRVEELLTQIDRQTELITWAEQLVTDNTATRGHLDVLLQQAVKSAEVAGLSAVQYRELFGGIEPRIAAACARVALDSAGKPFCHCCVVTSPVPATDPATACPKCNHARTEACPGLHPRVAATS